MCTHDYVYLYNINSDSCDIRVRIGLLFVHKSTKMRKKIARLNNIINVMFLHAFPTCAMLSA